MKTKIAALIWRLVATILSTVGIVGLFIIDNLPYRQLFYFTMQTNIFVLAMTATLTVMTVIQIMRKDSDSAVAHLNCSLQLAVTFFISITFLVYAIMLSSGTFSMVMGDNASPLLATSNILVHYIVPIMVIIDWILFMPHGNVSYKKIATYLLYPTFYLLFILISAEVGGPTFMVSADHISRFPYPFIDFDSLGIMTLAYIAGMTIAFMVLGTLFIYIDKAIPSIYKKLKIDKYKTVCYTKKRKKLDSVKQNDTKNTTTDME